MSKYLFLLLNICCYGVCAMEDLMIKKIEHDQAQKYVMYTMYFRDGHRIQIGSWAFKNKKIFHVIDSETGSWLRRKVSDVQAQEIFEGMASLHLQMKNSRKK